MVLALVPVFVLRRRWAAVVLAAVGPVAAAALTQFVLKPAIDRHLDVGLTFPSGHATGTFAVLIVAVISGVALVAAQYHFATDVVAGAAVGIGMVTGLALVLDPCAGLFRRGRNN